jgi:hypothetical protein
VSLGIHAGKAMRSEGKQVESTRNKHFDDKLSIFLGDDNMIRSGIISVSTSTAYVIYFKISAQDCAFGN